MSANDLTAEEFFESLSGYDEIAVTKHFGRTVVALSREDEMAFARALVFVAKRREGLTDSEAYNAALGATVREVSQFFAEDNEPMPSDPITESGKDGSGPEAKPNS